MHCAVVLIGSNANLACQYFARPSVCLSVLHSSIFCPSAVYSSFRTSSQSVKQNALKTKISVNFAQGRSNWCANSQFKEVRVEVRVVQLRTCRLWADILFSLYI